jgi:hypothetical protein
MTLLQPRWFLIGLFCLLAFGCSPPEEVRTYTEKKEAVVKQPPAVASDPDELKSRMIGLIIPLPTGYSYFVKFYGAIDGVTSQEKAFDEFVKTLSINDPNAPPTYSLPAGWQDVAPRQFEIRRFSTGSANAPQVSISEPTRGSLIENINRWRKQVGLESITEAELPTMTLPVTISKIDSFRVDLKGPAEPASGPMRGPFQGK